jgi:hypothetical protein
MTEEWNIQSPGHQCATTGKPFEKDEPIYTILSVGAEAFCRQDVCQAAWESAGGDLIRDKAGVVSVWKHLYVPPPPPEALKKEDAESILRGMLERNLPEEKEVRYILAVMLERKRIFKHRETLRPAPAFGGEPRPDGRGEINYLVYEHAKTGESFTIEDPHLRLDHLLTVQKRVAALLGPRSDTTPPAPESTPAVSSAE